MHIPPFENKNIPIVDSDDEVITILDDFYRKYALSPIF